MPSQAFFQQLTPLQRAIYEIDQLDLSVRESIKLASQRVGFFVGQQRYLEERKRIERLLAQEQ